MQSVVGWRERARERKRGRERERVSILWLRNYASVMKGTIGKILKNCVLKLPFQWDYFLLDWPLYCACRLTAFRWLKFYFSWPMISFLTMWISEIFVQKSYILWWWVRGDMKSDACSQFGWSCGSCGPWTGIWYW